MAKTSNDYVVFFAASHSERSLLLRSAVNEACKRAQQQLGRDVRLWEQSLFGFGPLVQTIFTGLRDADIVIADVSESSPNVMIELGVRSGVGRPIILVTEDTAKIPFDITNVYVLVYDLASSRSFVPQLAGTLIEMLKAPEQWWSPWFQAEPASQARRQPKTIFVSYSHKDVDHLARLRVHLKPLERSNAVELWDDTRIKAGEQWKATIEAALDRAVAAILLISADFLASDFIIQNELAPLLRSAEENGTLILPVIVKPSRYLRDANLNVFQAINDPNAPLIALPVAEQEFIWAKLAERIEAMMNPTGA